MARALKGGAMETETPDAPEIEEFPGDPDTDVLDPDEESLPDEAADDLEPEEDDEIGLAEAPDDPGTL
jgi:hypothetical protein